MSLDHKHFSIAEATSNQDGKTSGSAVLGLLGGIGAVLGFICGIVAYFIYKDTMLCTISTGFFATCVTLLAIRKSKESNKTLENGEN
tara:strand:+ start:1606 stop:1866 length:261 start_codon:yes stop_codon:yes gene_type:complete